MTNETLVKGDFLSRSPIADQTSWINDLQRKRISGPQLQHSPETGHGMSTLAVHAGTQTDPATGAVGTPIYQNSTFILNQEQYRSIEEGYPRDRFIYTRYGNPSQWAVQQKIAALEGAESALVFSSGMAAISASLLGLMDKGAHLVASNELYGGTYALLNQEFPSLGMSVSYVDPTDAAAIEAAIQPNTQILYFEAMTNPLLKLIDLPVVVDIARRHGLRVVIDATFLTPIACKVLDYGVDLVVHSATKYLNGHSDLLAGVAAGSRKLLDMIWPRLLSFGGCLDPHACFLLERGLKTLPIRMKAHEQSALALATFLEQHPRVKRVFYPRLKSHPQYALACKQLNNGTGCITFEIEGGDEMALSLLNTLKIPKQATSLGGIESLVSLPFNTSHAGFTSRQRANMGINPGFIRMSVGIEDAADLTEDFSQAFDLIYCEAPTALQL